VLAASGVVDAGAAGLCVLLDALSAAVTGSAPAIYQVPEATGRAAAGPAATSPASAGYEVTYLLAAAEQQVGQLRERLDTLGDSLVIVGGDGQWHVHVHVPDAGPAIEEGLQAGRPSRISVTYLGAIRPAGGHRVVAIADGPGLAELLDGAGALVVPQRGGRPPAAEALSAAFRQAGETLIIVPNGNNVAALLRTAASRLGLAGTQALVIDVRSPVQALAAVAVHDPQRDLADDAAAMSRAAASMRYASVGPAAAGHRRTPVVGRIGEDVVVRGASQGEIAIAVADTLLAGGAELVTLVQGERAEPGLSQLVAGHLRQVTPAAEVVCYEGGPADAFLLIGAE